MHSTQEGAADPRARMTKREVCDYLAKSKRTIENYVKTGQLACTYENAANGPAAVFDRAAVEAFHRTQSESWVKPVLVPNGQATATTYNARPAEAFNALANHFNRLARPRTQVLARYMTLDEAAAYSGMPKAWLRAQAHAGVEWAVNVSGGKREVWRFRVPRDIGVPAR